VESEHVIRRLQQVLTRRQFFGRGSYGVGAAALATLLNERSAAADSGAAAHRGLPGLPHFRPKVKRVIFLHQSGAPSQLDLFVDKPKLRELTDQPMPESLTQGQRIAQLRGQKLIVTGSVFKFAQHGQCGQTISELLPHTARLVDRLTFIHSMHTDAINHDPAITLMQTGFQVSGRPSLGAWLSYGLGSENDNLPAFVVLISGGSPGDQPLFSRLWGSGFLPSSHQGVKLRSSGDPVLFLSNPPGIDGGTRREMLDVLAQLNRLEYEALGDPEISARIAQYEMAYRMQTSVPELTDLSKEPESTFELYGPDARKPGTFAANALLARRLAERGVRFIQLYHRDWDHHGGLVQKLPVKCRETDQASAALITDLQQRGMLDDTLVFWGGEFGRTPMRQGGDAKNYGRDHHNKAFTVWMAGGGLRPGVAIGASDEFGYNNIADPVHVHDLHATLLHLLGIDHEALTFKYQGRHFRLTDTAGVLVKKILA